MVGIRTSPVKLTNARAGLRGFAASVSIRPVNKILMLMMAAWLALASAQAQPVRVDAVEVELVARTDAAVPGVPLMLGLRIRHDPHWHTYWRNPGDSGLPTTLELALPEGWQAGEIVWPAPKRMFIGPLANYGYEDEVLLPFPVQVPAQARAGPVRLSARVQWLMCREVCIPGEAEVALTLPVAAQASPSAAALLFERAALATPPPEPLAARVGLADRTVSLVFEHAQAGSAEFFPYANGLVSAPAPQTLHRLPQETGWRLELTLADGVGREQLAQGGFLQGRVGLLVLDGQPLEVQVSGDGAVSDGGTLVSTAAGADAARAPLGAGAGLGSRLLEGLGSADATGGGAAVGAASASTGTLGLALALGFGVLGGLILNLMPCVFPVIGLKVLGFAGADGRGSGRAGALAFAAGVLLAFWALAALLLALRGAGQAVGWGFQLQSPAFVALMALLFVAIGLNFAGVFEVGLRMTRLGGAEAAVAGRGGLSGSFGAGALAVLVATPCTAPFMGSALGYTLGRPATEVFLVFAAIALGMSLPYLVFGFFPRTLAWLPRPGRWMESFRQLLAFPMFATVAWLAWVLGLQAGADAVLGLMLGAVLLALSGWLYGRFVQRGPGRGRALAAVLAALALLGGAWLALPGGPAGAAAGSTAGQGAQFAAGQSTNGWSVWSVDAVERARSAGQPVFVDFTAAWCVSCQANKKLVLDREAVAGEMQRLGVLRLRADWTQRDPAITAALASHGRNGVPLYLLYLPGEAQPQLLPEILTPGIVLEALAQLR